MRLCLAILVFSMGFIGAPLAYGQAEDLVDFEKQVLPILQLRCFECHANDQDQGDLKLDSAEAIERGGHSGATIVASTPEESELYLRITSTSPGYQMPKRQKPLSTNEIDIIKRWIEQGGTWSVSQTTTRPALPAKASEFEEDRSSLTLIGRLAELWNRAGEQLALPSGRYSAWVSIGFAILFALMWLVPRFETNQQRKMRDRGGRDWQDVGGDLPNTEADAQGEIGVGPRTVSSLKLWGRRIGWFVFAGVACLAAFLWGRVETLQGRQNADHGLLEKKTSTTFSEVIVSPENLVQPPYPMHPRRLGGLYYRGNDERSDQLFNGGFYRTATIELYLTDADGERLAWGDETVDRDLFVELTIRRAANATTELFLPRVQKSTYLKHFPTSSGDGIEIANRIDFEVVEPLEVWRARIQVASADAEVPVTDGMLYLMYGAQTVTGSDGETQVGRVHFGIKYTVDRTSGLIGPNSELWMGSIYNLNGRVLVPGKGEVLLDRWFDFRPIPEIEGEPTKDPDLLGLPEHKSVEDNG